MSEPGPDPAPPPRLGSTYRLQLSGLGFAGAAALVPYLHELGIETLYCSPILSAVPGSTHGYDAVDPTRLDPELGGPDAFKELLAALGAHGMRLLIDIVPNHLAAHPANPWWWDVLRHGPQSVHAPVFDIDWEAQGGKVLLPTLSQPLADILASGEGAAVVDEPGQKVLALDRQRFPLDPATHTPAGPLSSGQALALHARQHYRLSHWRLSGDEVNYRRFFDIDGLVGVGVEDPAVFAATHALLLSLAEDERVAGFRVDHVDGLARPGLYLHQLRQALQRRRPTPVAIVVEKILGPNEALPPDWPVEGTTGYEFADLAGALFIAPSLPAAGFDVLAERAKRQVLEASFGSSLDRLVALAARALDRQTPGHDLSRASLHQAVSALTIHLDVYRTYFTGNGAPQPPDIDRITAAATSAQPHLSLEPARALRALVGGLVGGEQDWAEFARRWQQLTGAVMAKGVEDTATYRWTGLLGHAEVGSNPERAALTPAQFVATVAARSRTHPLSLNTTSTHDAKRSEDVRARLYTLTEWGDEWFVQVARWRNGHREWIGRHRGPDPQAAHLCYQSLVALWPTDRSSLGDDETRRLEDYVVKAAREAKERSSWQEPDAAYEAALVAFVRHLRDDPDFGADAMAWTQRLGPAAATTSLALVVLKVVCPGTPDVYQGNEIWEYALTDPDNRRAVDFEHRRHLLGDLRHADTGPGGDPSARAAALLGSWPDGRLKLHVLHTLLRHRRASPALFTQGDLTLLEVSGARAANVIALARHHQGQWVITVLPRLMGGLIGAAGATDDGGFALGAAFWGDTTIERPRGAPHQLADLFTRQSHQVDGDTIHLARVLDVLPVAVLFGA